MRRLLFFILCCAGLLGLLSRAQAQSVRAPKKKFELYAQFLVDTRIELSDGSEWSMDKGDCFPVDMFKEQQTKIVLKLGADTFTVETARMRVLKEEETQTALDSYRVTLENYLKSRSNRWKDAAGSGAKKNTVAPAPAAP